MAERTRSQRSDFVDEFGVGAFMRKIDGALYLSDLRKNEQFQRSMRRV
jgi:hypothetical protein